MIKNRTTKGSIIVEDGLVEKIKLSIEPALASETVMRGKRKLGITGGVGEILVCHQLGL